MNGADTPLTKGGNMRITAIVLLGAILCACASDRLFMPDATVPARERAIKQKFEQVSDDILREEHASLTPEAAEELAILWQAGARQLVEDDATQSKVAEATGKARSIVLAALEQTGTAGKQADRTLTRNIVQRVRRSICPVYPFC